MKAQKSRYQYQISEASYNQMHDEVARAALRDGARQGIVICMMALEMAYGWRGSRLAAFYNAVDEILHMPKVFGKEPTADDAIDRLRDWYHIDLDKLEIKIDLEVRHE